MPQTHLHKKVIPILFSSEYFSLSSLHTAKNRIIHLIFTPPNSTITGEKYRFGANKYRYGFNGKERDTESFEGAYDFGARILDARLGRWLSVDPLCNKYPAISGYVVIGNTPIRFVDSDGRVLRDESGNIIFYYNGNYGEITKGGITYAVYEGYVVADNGDWVAVQYLVLKTQDENQVITNSQFSYNYHGYSLLDGQFVVDSSQEASNDLIQGESNLDSDKKLTEQVNWNICEARKGDIICLFNAEGVVVHSYIYEGITEDGEYGASSKNGFNPIDKNTTITEVYDTYKKVAVNPAVAIGFVKRNGEEKKASAESLAKERGSSVVSTSDGVTIITP